MAEKILVREAFTLEGIVYGPAWEIPLAVWLRVPVRERNTLLNTAKVERCLAPSLHHSFAGRSTYSGKHTRQNNDGVTRGRRWQ